MYWYYYWYTKIQTYLVQIRTSAFETVFKYLRNLSHLLRSNVFWNTHMNWWFEQFEMSKSSIKQKMLLICEKKKKIESRKNWGDERIMHKALFVLLIEKKINTSFALAPSFKRCDWNGNANGNRFRILCNHL